jgi:hypothetical protein
VVNCEDSHGINRKHREERKDDLKRELRE